MVLTLMLPLRALYGLHDLITQRHIDNMCKICLGTGSIVGYAYIVEFFIAGMVRIHAELCFLSIIWSILMGLLHYVLMQCVYASVILV